MNRRRILYTLATAAAICGVAFILYTALCDPETSPAPQCLFHRITGWDCPGCGSQRAIHAIACGRPGDAWHYNPALFFAIPIAILYIAAPRRWRPVLEHPATIGAIIAATVIFTVLRNLL